MPKVILPRKEDVLIRKLQETIDLQDTEIADLWFVIMSGGNE